MKTRKRLKKNNNKNLCGRGKLQKNTRKLGGRAIDSGGYGCIFSPQIESYNCSGNTARLGDKSKYISKLMLKSDAEEEYSNARKINQVIQRGDVDIFRYVLTNDTSICELRMMNKEDLNGYSTHCKKLKDKGFDFSENNLSDITPERLRKLRTINSPYGGKNLYTIFNFLRESPSMELNRQFCVSYSLKVKEVYENAVYKLYNLSPKIIHGDMKEENLICKFSKSPLSISGAIKVIDWGLSYIYDSTSSNNPLTNLKSAIYQISRRPYQFNLPFSILFYSSDFQDEYRERVLIQLNSSRTSNKIDQWRLIQDFCNSYFNNQYFYESRNGERKYMLDDFNKSIFVLIKRVFPDIRMSLEDYVRKYLTTALNKYTYATRKRQSLFALETTTTKMESSDINFHIDVFSYEIYLPMVDSYGFFLTYGSLLSYLLFKDTNSQSLSSVNKLQSYTPTSEFTKMKGGGNTILSPICKFIAKALLSNCLVFDSNIKGREYRTKILNSTNEIHDKISSLIK